MVEQLGSGVPRILESYDQCCFSFSENFLRMSFPAIGGQVTPQVTPQVKSLIFILIGEMTRSEIQEKLKLSDRMNFLNNYLQPALKEQA